MTDARALTWEERSHFAAQASFLKERMPWSSGPEHRELSAEQEALLETWKRNAGGNGGERAFSKRLAADRLDGERARHLAAGTVPREDASIPDWVRELDAILSAWPAGNQPLRQTTWLPAPVHTEASGRFLTALLPFIAYAEQQLLQVYGRMASRFKPAALAELSGALADSLHRLCSKTYQAEFRAYIHRKSPLQAIMGVKLPPDQMNRHEQSFREALLAGGWKTLLLSYPVLARLMMTAIFNWIRNTAQFAGYLEQDMGDLESVFYQGRILGNVTGMECCLSDPHNKGKTVLIATFESGRKIVFKPRSAVIDEAWTQWVRWLESEGLRCFRTPRVLNRDDRCWMEFIEPLPVGSEEEAGLYYERAGVLLCLLYVLGGDDFHMENVIAHGSHPVLIDTETLLQHRVKPFVLGESGMNSQQVAHHVLVDSVLRTGLLPIWQTNSRGQAEDWSGLCGHAGGGANIPRLDGRMLQADDYVDRIVAGFERAFDFIAERKGRMLGPRSPLQLFERCRLRTLTRGTQIYGDVLERVLHPKYVRNGLAYSIEIERLAAAFLLHDAGEQFEELWRVFVSERDALEAGDVPIFYGNACDLALRDASSVLHGRFFMESALERCKSLIGSMDANAKRAQTGYIRASLSIYRESSHGLSSSDSEQSREFGTSQGCSPNEPLFLEEASALYGEAVERRIEAAENDFTWIVMQLDASSHKIILGSINHSLYDGVIGLGTYMAALYRITKDEEIKRMAMSSIRPLLESLRSELNPLPLHRFPLGIGNGVAGLIRGMTAMARYLEEEVLFEAVRYMVRRIPFEQIEDDCQLDLFGGCAGLIPELAAMYRYDADDHILALAQRCGQRLLDQRIVTKSGYRVWDNGLGFAPLTGAAHGAAGYATALLRLYGLTGETDYREAALEAIGYENGLFDEGRLNWPDLRLNRKEDGQAGKSYMRGWCSGAPGIGMERLSSLRHLDGAAYETVKRDVELAIEFTMQASLESVDTLCCGSAGTIDFLIEASLVLKRPELLRAAKDRAERMLRRKRGEGHFRFSGSEGGVVFNPSLFHGTSGIGYTLLRCCAPDDIFSILKR